MRKRKPKVVWLPMALESFEDPNQETPALIQLGLDIPAFQNPPISVTEVVPLVRDEPQGVASADKSLADLEGSAYRLRRVVGKIFVESFQGLVDVNAPRDFVVTVGLIVLRVQEDGTPLALAEAYSAFSLQNIRDPWIWRRTWLVRNNLDLGDAGFETHPRVPSSNMWYGSALDGPHIDAKTARVISDEERLFLVASGVARDGNAQAALTGSVIVTADLRILATMRSQSGNRRNASR